MLGEGGFIEVSEIFLEFLVVRDFPIPNDLMLGSNKPTSCAERTLRLLISRSHILHILQLFRLLPLIRLDFLYLNPLHITNRPIGDLLEFFLVDFWDEIFLGLGAFHQLHIPIFKIFTRVKLLNQILKLVRVFSLSQFEFRLQIKLSVPLKGVLSLGIPEFLDEKVFLGPRLLGHPVFGVGLLSEKT